MPQKLVNISVTIAALFPTYANAQEWRLYSSSADGTPSYFYDPSSVQVYQNGVTGVTTKATGSPLAEEGEAFRLHRIEIHCRERTTRIRSVTAYDAGAHVIDQLTFPEDAKMGNFLERSPAAALYEAVCPLDGQER